MAVEFHHRQLPNGLSILAETNPDAHTAAMGFFVRTGARDEQRPLMGVSHFLEHMMFKGTARRTADDVNREFDEIGADYNAYTSEEVTAYWAHVLPEFLPRATDLLCDMLRPSLRQEDFDVEKKVILEEIGMYDDRPHWRLFDTIMETHYGSHPLGHRVLGTTQTVTDLGVQQMRDYFAQRYSPDNMILAAAGKVDFEQLVAQVAKATQTWQPTGVTRSYELPQLRTSERAMTDKVVSRHYVAMLCPAPSAQDPRRYAAKVLEHCLGDDEGSRLYWALVDPGLADEADLSFSPQDQVGNYMGFASCDPDRAAQVERILIETIDGFASDIKADELERAKNKLATSVTLHGESPGGRMRGLGGQWLYLGQYTPLEVELERLMAVTVQDVRDLVKDFPFAPRTVVRLGPQACEPANI